MLGQRRQMGSYIPGMVLLILSNANRELKRPRIAQVISRQPTLQTLNKTGKANKVICATTSSS